MRRDTLSLCLSQAPGYKPDPQKDKETSTKIGPEIRGCHDKADTKDHKKDPEQGHDDTVPAPAVPSCFSSISGGVHCGGHQCRPDEPEPHANQQARAGIIQKKPDPEADE